MSGFTLGSMYWINPKYTLADFREDLRRVRENRITLLRIFIQWEYVEVEKGKFDFSIYDTFFRAAEEAGIELMPTLLFYLPYHRLAEQERRGESDVGRRYPCLDRPAIREGLERFFAETVRRYKAKGISRLFVIFTSVSAILKGDSSSSMTQGPARRKKRLLFSDFRNG